MASSYEPFVFALQDRVHLCDLDSAKMLTIPLIASFVALAAAHDGHGHEETILGPHKSLWYNTLPGDGGTQVSFSLDVTPFDSQALTILLHRQTLYSPAYQRLDVYHTNHVWPMRM